MSAASIIPLVCPDCGDALRGLAQDVVFSCPGCKRLLEVLGDKFVQRHGGTAMAADPSRPPALHLPVWAFRVQSKWAWPDPKREAEAALIPPLPWIYVTAFSLHNPSYFGDPGLIFSERRVELRPGDSVPLLGCIRGLEAASAFVESHLLTIVDRRVDVTGLHLTCIIEEARLWAVPFFEAGDALVDGILGLRLPSAAVTDLASLRAALGAR